MKRLALLLGSLLVVTAAASAKEVVPAPVVVEEAPVQIIEKEVIVYREKEQGFRPNGNVALEYKYYGKTEDNRNNSGVGSWNDSNDYSRIQLSGKVNATENQTVDFRVRAYNSLGQDADTNPTYYGNSTETRLRYYYNAGNLGDSKVGVTPFLQYKNKTSGTQQVRADLRFDFADYLFDNDFIKTTVAEFGPSYMYTWNDDNSSNYTNSVGYYFDFYNQLPGGFAFELKSDDDASYYNMYGAEGKDDEFKATLGAYLYHDANLYTNGAYSLDWHFEGGYDQYTWASRTLGVDTDSKRSYKLYAQPSLIFSYAATEFVTLTGTVGAEYGNWVNTNETSAQDWRWQPFVAAGFNVAF